MSDMSDDDINNRSDMDPGIMPPAKTVEVIAMAREIRRHREARTIDAKRVRAVVREAADMVIQTRGFHGALGAQYERILDGIADRVAAQLTAPPPGHVCPVPYALSPEDLDTLSELQSLTELSDWPRACAVLAQILAAHRAPEPADKQVPTTKLLDVQNGVFTKLFPISKRNGYCALSTEIHGERGMVATPAGTIDGAQWLANRGLAEDPTEYPAHRIARGDQ